MSTRSQITLLIHGLRFGWLAVFAFWLSFVEATATTAPDYRIEGTLQYLIGEARVPRFTREFSLRSKGCAWAIHVGIHDPVGLAYAEVVHDGASIYTYQGFDDSVNKSGAINKGVAAIDSGDAPFENATCANYVWLGLASACYFQRLTNSEVRAPWALAKRGQGTALASWELLGPAPSLPSRVTFSWGPGLLPRPFDGGWVGGELRVDSSTNFGGFLIPLNFSYQQFRPKREAKTKDDLDLQFEVRVSVKSVQLGSVGDIAPPQTPGVTMVEDRRLETPLGSPTVVYPSTNARLAQAPELPALQRQKQFRLVAAARTLATPSSGRRYIVLTLVALSSAPLVFVLLRRLWRAQQTGMGGSCNKNKNRKMKGW